MKIKFNDPLLTPPLSPLIPSEEGKKLNHSKRFKWLNRWNVTVGSCCLISAALLTLTARHFLQKPAARANGDILQKKLFNMLHPQSALDMCGLTFPSTEEVDLKLQSYKTHDFSYLKDPNLYFYGETVVGANNQTEQEAAGADEMPYIITALFKVSTALKQLLAKETVLTVAESIQSSATSVFNQMKRAAREKLSTRSLDASYFSRIIISFGAAVGGLQGFVMGTAEVLGDIIGARHRTLAYEITSIFRSTLVGAMIGGTQGALVGIGLAAVYSCFNADGYCRKKISEQLLQHIQ